MAFPFASFQRVIQEMPIDLMEQVLGENGRTIWDKANGIDKSPVIPYSEQKSMSTEQTYDRDTTDMQKLRKDIITMVDFLSFDLIKMNKLTGCVSIKIRYSNFDTHTKQARIPYTSYDISIIQKILELFQTLYTRRMMIRPENLILRTGIALEQVIILIRVGALRFTGCNKKELLWEEHSLLNKPVKQDNRQLFRQSKKVYDLPKFETLGIEYVYDEMELLGFSVSRPLFDMLKTSNRGEITVKDLPSYEGKTIRILGDYVTYKPIMTIKNEYMAFGTFLDIEGNFFDTPTFRPH